MRHQRQHKNPGGAGNVACNLAALGLAVKVIGLAGADADGDRLLCLLNKAGVNTELVRRSPDRPTTSKSRDVSGRHQLLRFDVEETGQMSRDVVQILENTIQEKRSAEPQAIDGRQLFRGSTTIIRSTLLSAEGRMVLRRKFPQPWGEGHLRRRTMLKGYVERVIVAAAKNSCRQTGDTPFGLRQRRRNLRGCSGGDSGR